MSPCPFPLVFLLIVAGTVRLTAVELNDELLATVRDSKLTLADRNAAVRQLAQSKAGAGKLAAMAESGELADELRTPVAFALYSSTDPAIRTLGQQKVPMPKLRDGGSLPPLNELLVARGDAAKGKAVFDDPRSGNCSSCHLVDNVGRDVGPPLNTIGEKGKDVLLESILLPSIDIQHGFHLYVVKTKTQGTKSGLLLEDSDEKVTLKDLNGEYVDIPATEIVRKMEQKTSLMPEGLIATMSLQELTDLLEYLSTLKVQ